VNGKSPLVQRPERDTSQDINDYYKVATHYAKGSLTSFTQFEKISLSQVIVMILLVVLRHSADVVP